MLDSTVIMQDDRALASSLYLSLPPEQRRKFGDAIASTMRLQGLRRYTLLERWAEQGLTEAYNPSQVSWVLRRDQKWDFVLSACEELMLSPQTLVELAMTGEKISEIALVRAVQSHLHQLAMLANGWPHLVRPWLARAKREKLEFDNRKRIEKLWQRAGMVKSIRCGQVAFAPTGHKVWTVPMTEIAIRTLKLDTAAACLKLLAEVSETTKKVPPQ